MAPSDNSAGDASSNYNFSIYLSGNDSVPSDYGANSSHRYNFTPSGGWTYDLVAMGFQGFSIAAFLAMLFATWIARRRRGETQLFPLNGFVSTLIFSIICNVMSIAFITYAYGPPSGPSYSTIENTFTGLGSASTFTTILQRLVMLLFVYRLLHFFINRLPNGGGNFGYAKTANYFIFTIICALGLVDASVSVALRVTSLDLYGLENPAIHLSEARAILHWILSIQIAIYTAVTYMKTSTPKNTLGGPVMMIVVSVLYFVQTFPLAIAFMAYEMQGLSPPDYIDAALAAIYELMSVAIFLIAMLVYTESTPKGLHRPATGKDEALDAEW